MRWSTPEDISGRLAAALDSGTLLREDAVPTGRFPWRLPLRGPRPHDLLENLHRVRDWVVSWERTARGQGLVLEWRRLGGRAIGASDVPSALVVETLDDAARLARRTDAVDSFRRARWLVAERRPSLLTWVDANPVAAARLVREPGEVHADDEDRPVGDALSALLAVVDWFEANPGSGLYLRQVDVPGVGTKFLETHRGVLSVMLDLAVPAAVVAPAATGLRSFARRYGLRDAADALVRIRTLDPHLQPWPGADDLMLSTTALAELPVKPEVVVVTENKVNFLALPALEGCLALFGAGYGFAALREVGWLRDLRVLYWGDVDTHGFAILDQLRGDGIDAHSVLMDRETFLTHRAQWVHETAPTVAPLTRLRSAEAGLYRELVENRYGRNVRLEQERIGFTWARDHLVTAVNP